MITRNQIATAQRTAPNDEATKQLQRDYAKQGQDLARARRAKEREEAQAEERAKSAELREQIAALDLVLPEGMDLRGFTIAHAQYAGMAPKMAGGWVAVGLPMLDDKWFFALVPTSWNGGFTVRPEEMRQVCLENAGFCCDAEESEILADALAKLSTLTQ